MLQGIVLLGLAHINAKQHNMNFLKKKTSVGAAFTSTKASL
jgi:hypothetical protein